MQMNRWAFRELRESRGLTLSDVARLTGSSQSYLSRVEAGDRNASPRLINEIASALKCPVAALLCDPTEVRR